MVCGKIVKMRAVIDVHLETNGNEKTLDNLKPMKYSEKTVPTTKTVRSYDGNPRLGIKRRQWPSYLETLLIPITANERKSEEENLVKDLTHLSPIINTPRVYSVHVRCVTDREKWIGASNNHD